MTTALAILAGIAGIYAVGVVASCLWLRWAAGKNPVDTLPWTLGFYWPAVAVGLLIGAFRE